MLATIKKHDLHADHLGWLCIKPVIDSIKGKNMTIKLDLYSRLNQGQKALLMFYVFHNRTNSIAEFYWVASYFIGEMKVWNEMKTGMEYFEDIEMLHIYEELETLIAFKNRLSNGQWLAVSPADVETDHSFMESMNKYKLRAPITIEQINVFIRNNQETFIKVIRSEI